MGNPIHLNPAHKGQFHRDVGKSPDQPITEADIEKGEHSSNPAERKRAQFADNARSFHHAGHMSSDHPDPAPQPVDRMADEAIGNAFAHLGDGAAGPGQAFPGGGDDGSSSGSGGGRSFGGASPTSGFKTASASFGSEGAAGSSGARSSVESPTGGSSSPAGDSLGSAPSAANGRGTTTAHGLPGTPGGKTSSASNHDGSKNAGGGGGSSLAEQLDSDAADSTPPTFGGTMHRAIHGLHKATHRGSKARGY